MLEKPMLTDEALAAALHTTYGITVAHLDFLPLGNDSNAWVYRVQAAHGAVYFLKVRRGTLNPVSLIIPRLLKDRGIAQVIAPLPTRQQTLWTTHDEFALSLYPFVTGVNGIEADMTHDHWQALGRIVRQMHALPLPADVKALLRHETLIAKQLDAVIELQATLPTFAPNDEFQRELVALWHEHAAEITHVIERTQTLEAQLHANMPDFGLCHADIHPYNLLIEPDGALWVIDWDEAIFAPKERDLMFVGGGIGGDANGDQQAAWFYEGYGDAAVNKPLIAYYRYEWVLQDIADFVRRVFFDAEVGDDTKAQAVRIFRGIFTAGDMVDMARRADEA